MAVLLTEAKVWVFKDFVNTVLLRDATEESGEEQHCQAFREYNGETDEVI